MDGTEYLEQISSTVRPDKKPKFNFMSSLIFKLAIGAVIVFIALAIIGGILSGGKADIKEQTISLNLHISNTLSTISEYKSNLKSSDLRSSSASLYSVLSNTNRDLDEYISKKYSVKSGSEGKKLKDEAKLHNDELVNSLFEAKITGTLDRIFAHKMAYEISLITTKETSIYNASGDGTLKTILESSYNSLENLYDRFNDFSEIK